MPSYDIGTCEGVIDERRGMQVLRVQVKGATREAVLYERFAAPASVGDRLVVNTTAVELGLGSGGRDFVVCNLESPVHRVPSGGHIMKLRYTPAQVDVVAVEAPESPHHDTLRSARELGGMPVVAASLHSQLLGVVAAIRTANPLACIAYVMTDGGALEAGMSDTVGGLRRLGWITATITCGHALGGDLEAVNVYSALLAARHVVEADVTVVGMGPGVVGTDTPLGTTAIELGLAVNAAASLRGRPVAAVRMSQADRRGRHRGISHHAATALDVVALAGADVPVPAGMEAAVKVGARHRVVGVPGSERVWEAIGQARAAGVPASHMGRDPQQDPLFFLASAAAGFHAAGLLPS